MGAFDLKLFPEFRKELAADLDLTVLQIHHNSRAQAAEGERKKRIRDLKPFRS